jgi:AAA domain
MVDERLEAMFDEILGRDHAPRNGHHPGPLDLPACVDWPDFWTRDHSLTDWFVEPLIPAGRQVVVFAPAGVGKSLLALEVAAAVATGRKVLAQPAGPARHVLYLDFEMTEADLQERLIELGYGPEDDLSHLHYALLPSIPPLDTPAGGDVLAALVGEMQAELVVIDTMARAVKGEENSADTYRAFYTCTGILIRATGASLLRLDHAGKDVTRGQRGSSEKAGDVDLVWQLTVGDGGVSKLKALKRRVGWVPEEIALERREDPVLVHAMTDEHVWPAGTRELADLLDELDVPIGASTRVAGDALRVAGTGKRRALIVAACRFRVAGTTSGTTLASLVPSKSGTRTPINGSRPAREPFAEPSGTISCGESGGPPPKGGTTTPDPSDDWENPF